MPTKPTAAVSYLPQDRPHLETMLTLGLRHVLTMFPATVFAARARASWS